MIFIVENQTDSTCKLFAFSKSYLKRNKKIHEIKDYLSIS